MDKVVRIVYMGTPDFAVPALNALCRSGMAPVLVVTRPDRPRGRGHRLAHTPVKEKALELGLPVLQPDSLRDGGEWARALQRVRPDLIVVCAYGKILPKETLGVPRLGCVNIHASLLPKYRGAAPVHRAVEAGEIESGVTLIYMSEGMDEGDIIASRSISIKGMTSGEATGSLAQLGAELLSDELSTIIGGTARRVPQDDAEATYAPPVLREEGSIDFSGAPDGIVRKILAMTPSPGAYAFLGVEKIKVIGACASLDTFGNKAPRPGEVVSVSGGVIRIASGKGGSVEITRLQSPGGKPMSSAEWLRGHALEPGALFE